MSRSPQSPQLAQMQARLAALLAEVAAAEGTYPSPYPGVELTRLHHPSPRRPCVYKQGILVVGQGQKRGYVGDSVLPYDAHNYLVLCAPMTFECDYDCSPEEPLLAALIDVSPTVVNELLLELDESLPAGPALPRAIHSTPIDERFCDAVIRLMECLRSPRDCKVLARQIIREIIYLVLIGEQGHALSALALRNEHFHQIARVLFRIHDRPSEVYDVAKLAREAGMSTTTFHHCFREVTTTSPMQYVKRIRLDRARWLIAYEKHTANAAAALVGYESPSQFSREFKRLFGASPLEEAAKLRSLLKGS